MTNPLKKFSASLVLFTFSITQFFNPGQAFAAPSHPVSEIALAPGFELQIPSELGSIETVVAGNGPTLFHIQTAHGNYEAQKNIQQILHHLYKQYGVDLLLLEGTAFKLNPEMLRFFPSFPEDNRAVNDELAKKALVKGPELFLLEEPEAEAYGIENLEAYKSNLVSFQGIIAEREKTESFLKDLHLQIERLTSPYLKKELRDFLNRAQAFDKKHISLSDWLAYLKKQASKSLGIDLTHPVQQAEWPMLVRLFTLEEIEQHLDRERYEEEKAAFLKEIGMRVNESASERVTRIPANPFTRKLTAPQTREPLFYQIENLLNGPLTGRKLSDPQTFELFEALVTQLGKFDYQKYPHVTSFIGHLILQSEIKSNDLMSEITRLTDEIALSMTDSEEERQVLGLLKDYRLLEKLFALELTPGEYQQIGDRRWVIGDKTPNIEGIDLPSAISHLPSKLIGQILNLNKKKLVKDTKFKNLSDLDHLYAAALEFYEGVQKRDGWMLANIEHRMKATGKTQAVIVTGGFHAGPFQNYLTGKGYSYGLIAPHITNLNTKTMEGERENYVHTMLRNSSGVRVNELAGERVTGKPVNSQTGEPLNESASERVTRIPANPLTPVANKANTSTTESPLAAVRVRDQVEIIGSAAVIIEDQLPAVLKTASKDAAHLLDLDQSVPENTEEGWGLAINRLHDRQIQVTGKPGGYFESQGLTAIWDSKRPDKIAMTQTVRSELRERWVNDGYGEFDLDAAIDNARRQEEEERKNVKPSDPGFSLAVVGSPWRELQIGQDNTEGNVLVAKVQRKSWDDIRGEFVWEDDGVYIVQPVEYIDPYTSSSSISYVAVERFVPNERAETRSSQALLALHQWLATIPDEELLTYFGVDLAAEQSEKTAIQQRWSQRITQLLSENKTTLGFDDETLFKKFVDSLVALERDVRILDREQTIAPYFTLDGTSDEEEQLRMKTSDDLSLANQDLLSSSFMADRLKRIAAQPLNQKSPELLRNLQFAISRMEFRQAPRQIAEEIKIARPSISQPSGMTRSLRSSRDNKTTLSQHDLNARVSFDGRNNQPALFRRLASLGQTVQNKIPTDRPSWKSSSLTFKPINKNNPDDSNNNSTTQNHSRQTLTPQDERRNQARQVRTEIVSLDNVEEGENIAEFKVEKEATFRTVKQAISERLAQEKREPNDYHVLELQGRVKAKTLLTPGMHLMVKYRDTLPSTRDELRAAVDSLEARPEPRVNRITEWAGHPVELPNSDRPISRTDEKKDQPDPDVPVKTPMTAGDLASQFEAAWGGHATQIPRISSRTELRNPNWAAIQLLENATLQDAARYLLNVLDAFSPNLTVTPAVYNSFSVAIESKTPGDYIYFHVVFNGTNYTVSAKHYPGAENKPITEQETSDPGQVETLLASTLESVSQETGLEIGSPASRTELRSDDAELDEMIRRVEQLETSYALSTELYEIRTQEEMQAGIDTGSLGDYVVVLKEYLQTIQELKGLLQSIPGKRGDLENRLAKLEKNINDFLAQVPEATLARTELRISDYDQLKLQLQQYQELVSKVRRLEEIWRSNSQKVESHQLDFKWTEKDPPSKYERDLLAIRDGTGKELSDARGRLGKVYQELLTTARRFGFFKIIPGTSDSYDGDGHWRGVIPDSKEPDFEAIGRNILTMIGELAENQLKLGTSRSQSSTIFGNLREQFNQRPQDLFSDLKYDQELADGVRLLGALHLAETPLYKLEHTDPTSQNTLELKEWAVAWRKNDSQIQEGIKKLRSALNGVALGTAQNEFVQNFLGKLLEFAETQETIFNLLDRLVPALEKLSRAELRMYDDNTAPESGPSTRVPFGTGLEQWPLDHEKDNLAEISSDLGSFLENTLDHAEAPKSEGTASRKRRFRSETRSLNQEQAVAETRVGRRTLDVGSKTPIDNENRPTSHVDTSNVQSRTELRKGKRGEVLRVKSEASNNTPNARRTRYEESRLNAGDDAVSGQANQETQQGRRTAQKRQTFLKSSTVLSHSSKFSSPLSTIKPKLNDFNARVSFDGKGNPPALFRRLTLLGQTVQDKNPTNRPSWTSSFLALKPINKNNNNHRDDNSANPNHNRQAFTSQDERHNQSRQVSSDKISEQPDQVLSSLFGKSPSRASHLGPNSFKGRVADVLTLFFAQDRHGVNLKQIIKYSQYLFNHFINYVKADRTELRTNLFMGSGRSENQPELTIEDVVARYIVSLFVKQIANTEQTFTREEILALEFGTGLLAGTDIHQLLSRITMEYGTEYSPSEARAIKTGNDAELQSIPDASVNGEPEKAEILGLAPIQATFNADESEVTLHLKTPSPAENETAPLRTEMRSFPRSWTENLLIEDLALIVLANHAAPGWVTSPMDAKIARGRMVQDFRQDKSDLTKFRNLKLRLEDEKQDKGLFQTDELRLEAMEILEEIYRAEGIHLEAKQERPALAPVEQVQSPEKLGVSLRPELRMEKETPEFLAAVERHLYLLNRFKEKFPEVDDSWEIVNIKTDDMNFAYYYLEFSTPRGVRWGRLALIAPEGIELSKPGSGAAGTHRLSAEDRERLTGVRRIITVPIDEAAIRGGRSQFTVEGATVRFDGAHAGNNLFPFDVSGPVNRRAIYLEKGKPVDVPGTNSQITLVEGKAWEFLTLEVTTHLPAARTELRGAKRSPVEIEKEIEALNANIESLSRGLNQTELPPGAIKRITDAVQAKQRQGDILTNEWIAVQSRTELRIQNERAIQLLQDTTLQDAARYLAYQLDAFDPVVNVTPALYNGVSIGIRPETLNAASAGHSILLNVSKDETGYKTSARYYPGNQELVSSQTSDPKAIPALLEDLIFNTGFKVPGGFISSREVKRLIARAIQNLARTDSSDLRKLAAKKFFEIDTVTVETPGDLDARVKWVSQDVSGLYDLMMTALNAARAEVRSTRLLLEPRSGQVRRKDGIAHSAKGIADQRNPNIRRSALGALRETRTELRNPNWAAVQLLKNATLQDAARYLLNKLDPFSPTLSVTPHLYNGFSVAIESKTSGDYIFFHVSFDGTKYGITAKHYPGAENKPIIGQETDDPRKVETLLARTLKRVSKETGLQIRQPARRTEMRSAVNRRDFMKTYLFLAAVLAGIPGLVLKAAEALTRRGVAFMPVGNARDVFGVSTDHDKSEDNTVSERGQASRASRAVPTIELSDGAKQNNRTELRSEANSIIVNPTTHDIEVKNRGRMILTIPHSLLLDKDEKTLGDVVVKLNEAVQLLGYGNAIRVTRGHTSYPKLYREHSAEMPGHIYIYKVETYPENYPHIYERSNIPRYDAQRIVDRITGFITGLMQSLADGEEKVKDWYQGGQGTPIDPEYDADGNWKRKIYPYPGYSVPVGSERDELRANLEIHFSDGTRLLPEGMSNMTLSRLSKIMGPDGKTVFVVRIIDLEKRVEHEVNPENPISPMTLFGALMSVQETALERLSPHFNKSINPDVAIYIGDSKQAIAWTAEQLATMWMAHFEQYVHSRRSDGIFDKVRLEGKRIGSPVTLTHVRLSDVLDVIFQRLKATKSQAESSKRNELRKESGEGSRVSSIASEKAFKDSSRYKEPDTRYINRAEVRMYDNNAWDGASSAKRIPYGTGLDASLQDQEKDQPAETSSAQGSLHENTWNGGVRDKSDIERTELRATPKTKSVVIGGVSILYPEKSRIVKQEGNTLVLRNLNEYKLTIEVVPNFKGDTYVKIGDAVYQVLPNAEGKQIANLWNLNPLGNPQWFEFMDRSAQSVDVWRNYHFALPTDDLREGETLRLFPLNTSPYRDRQLNLYPALVPSTFKQERINTAREKLHEMTDERNLERIEHNLYRITNWLVYLGTTGDADDYYDAQNLLQFMIDASSLAEYRPLLVQLSDHIKFSFEGVDWHKWKKIKQQIREQKKEEALKRTASVYELPVERIRLNLLDLGLPPHVSQNDIQNALSEWKVEAVEALAEGDPDVKPLETDEKSLVYKFGKKIIERAIVTSLVFAGGSATTVKKALGKGARHKLIHLALKVATNLVPEKWINLMQARIGLLLGQNPESRIILATNVSGVREGDSDHSVRQYLGENYKDAVKTGQIDIAIQRSGFVLNTVTGNPMRYKDGHVATVAEDHLWAFMSLLLNQKKVIEILGSTAGIISMGNGDNIINYARAGMAGEIEHGDLVEERKVATVPIGTPSAADRKGGFFARVTYRNTRTGAIVKKIEIREVMNFPTRDKAATGFDAIDLKGEEETDLYRWLDQKKLFIEDLFHNADGSWKSVAFNVAFYATNLRLLAARAFGLNEDDPHLLFKLRSIDRQAWVDKFLSIADQMPATIEPQKGAPNEDSSETVKGYMVGQKVQDLIVNGLGLLPISEGVTVPEIRPRLSPREDTFLPYKGTDQSVLGRNGKIAPPDVARTIAGGARLETYDLVANQLRYAGIIDELNERGHRMVLSPNEHVTQVMPVTSLQEIINANRTAATMKELFDPTGGSTKQSPKKSLPPTRNELRAVTAGAAVHEIRVPAGFITTEEVQRLIRIAIENLTDTPVKELARQKFVRIYVAALTLETYAELENRIYLLSEGNRALETVMKDALQAARTQERNELRTWWYNPALRYTGDEWLQILKKSGNKIEELRRPPHDDDIGLIDSGAVILDLIKRLSEKSKSNDSLGHVWNEQDEKGYVSADTFRNLLEQAIRRQIAGLAAQHPTAWGNSYAVLTRVIYPLIGEVLKEYEDSAHRNELRAAAETADYAVVVQPIPLEEIKEAKIRQVIREAAKESARKNYEENYGQSVSESAEFSDELIQRFIPFVKEVFRRGNAIEVQAAFGLSDWQADDTQNSPTLEIREVPPVKRTRTELRVDREILRMELRSMEKKIHDQIATISNVHRHHLTTDEMDFLFRADTKFRGGYVEASEAEILGLFQTFMFRTRQGADEATVRSLARLNVTLSIYRLLQSYFPSVGLPQTILKDQQNEVKLAAELVTEVLAFKVLSKSAVPIATAALKLLNEFSGDGNQLFDAAQKLSVILALRGTDIKISSALDYVVRAYLRETIAIPRERTELRSIHIQIERLIDALVREDSKHLQDKELVSLYMISRKASAGDIEAAESHLIELLGLYTGRTGKESDERLVWKLTDLHFLLHTYLLFQAHLESLVANQYKLAESTDDYAAIAFNVLDVNAGTFSPESTLPVNRALQSLQGALIPYDLIAAARYLSQAIAWEKKVQQRHILSSAFHYVVLAHLRKTLSVSADGRADAIVKFEKTSAARTELRSVEQIMKDTLRIRTRFKADRNKDVIETVNSLDEVSKLLSDGQLTESRIKTTEILQQYLVSTDNNGNPDLIKELTRLAILITSHLIQERYNHEALFSSRPFSEKPVDLDKEALEALYFLEKVSKDQESVAKSLRLAGKQLERSGDLLEAASHLIKALVLENETSRKYQINQVIDRVLRLHIQKFLSERAELRMKVLLPTAALTALRKILPELPKAATPLLNRTELRQKTVNLLDNSVILRPPTKKLAGKKADLSAVAEESQKTRSFASLRMTDHTASAPVELTSFISAPVAVPPIVLPGFAQVKQLPNVFTNPAVAKRNTPAQRQITDFKQRILPTQFHAELLEAFHQNAGSAFGVVLAGLVGGEKAYAEGLGRRAGQASAVKEQIGSGSLEIAPETIADIVRALRHQIKSPAAVGSVYAQSDIIARAAAENPRALYFLLAGFFDIQDELKVSKPLFATAVPAGELTAFKSSLIQALQSKQANLSGSEIVKLQLILERLRSNQLIEFIEVKPGQSVISAVNAYIAANGGVVSLHETAVQGLEAPVDYIIGENIAVEDLAAIAEMALLSLPLASKLKEALKDQFLILAEEHNALYFAGLTPSGLNRLAYNLTNIGALVARFRAELRFRIAA